MIIIIKMSHCFSLEYIYGPNNRVPGVKYTFLAGLTHINVALQGLKITKINAAIALK